jgi:hypothetical protein
MFLDFQPNYEPYSLEPQKVVDSYRVSA